jgi:signal transduction histidine kinase
MAEKQDGIKPSRKYANGTFHENASGRFQILDRFLGKDGIIYLKIQWVATGQIETNKEVNISASIWKYEKASGKVKPAEDKPPLPEVTLSDILEKVETLEEYLHEAHENRKAYQELLKSMHEEIKDSAISIGELTETKKGTTDFLKKLQEEVHDIREQLKDKNDTIERLLEMQRITQGQIAVLIQQNDIASKLIEKM